MCKIFLRNAQMLAVNYVSDAGEKARLLVQYESNGAGDTRGAMQRIAVRYGIPFSKLWALRYRPPKSIGAEFYTAILQAYSAEINRQARKFSDEQRETNPKTAFGRYLARAAAELAGEGGEALDPE